MKNSNLRWKRWELALCLALSVSVFSGLWAQRRQEALAAKLVRLHVVANSDSPADQAEKLRMRDKVTELLAPALAEARSQEEAVAILEAQRPALEALGDVRVQLTVEHFPTRDYVNFSLPAGDYLALRVILGEGRGQNWWCVLFPPLCTEALAAESQETFGLLSEDDKALVTQKDEGYVLKFRALELWDEFKELF